MHPQAPGPDIQAHTILVPLLKAAQSCGLPSVVFPSEPGFHLHTTHNTHTHTENDQRLAHHQQKEFVCIDAYDKHITALDPSKVLTVWCASGEAYPQGDWHYYRITFSFLQ